MSAYQDLRQFERDWRNVPLYHERSAEMFREGLLTRLQALAHDQERRLAALEAARSEPDLGHCPWCEEAQAPRYLAHEGHDPECPFGAVFTCRPPITVCTCCGETGDPDPRSCSFCADQGCEHEQEDPSQ